MMQRTILVVDDDASMRETLETLLANEKMVVYTAVDGKDAVAKTLSLKPDLILLDVNMPNLNGLSFCRAIRAGGETSNIPIIIVSGIAAKAQVEECLTAGADDFVAKPFRIEELMIRIRAMFSTPPGIDHMERINQYILALREQRLNPSK
jgi:DNA-binding response OmpR family regulator